MKILTTKKQAQIAKRLAVIFYACRHWGGEIGHQSNIIVSLVEIADLTGGIEMMKIVPKLADDLAAKLAEKEAHNDHA